MYSCDNDEVLMMNIKDLGQTGSDIKHMLTMDFTKTQQNTCLKKNKYVHCH